VYLAGSSTSATLPQMLPSVKPERSAQYIPDAMVMKVNLKGEVIASLFLGGNSIDQVNDLALTKGKKLVLVGATRSDNFPLSSDAYVKTVKGEEDSYFAFLAQVSSSLQEIPFSSYLYEDPSYSYSVSSDVWERTYISGSVQNKEEKPGEVQDEEITPADYDAVVRQVHFGLASKSTGFLAENPLGVVTAGDEEEQAVQLNQQDVGKGASNQSAAGGCSLIQKRF